MSHPVQALKQTARSLLTAKWIALGALAAGGYLLFTQPPVTRIGHQEVGLRLNRLTGSMTQLGEGAALLVPGVHELQRYSLQDQTWHPERMSQASGEAPLQSSEGLSIGAELNFRYAIDPERLGAVAGSLPGDVGGQVLNPLVQGVVYKQFARYTVREIFSTKRQELEDAIEAELKPLAASDGILLRSVMMGNIDLPPEYRAGMDQLLAVELQSEQMKYTLELKEKQVKESELQAQADKVRRETEAHAAASEQVIAAKAQEEAMKHVLPFKERQIEQRKLEAEADKASRIRTAEGTAEARRIEALGEADSRRKLAEAEAYRMEQLGRVSSTQLERDGALISKYPLLILKTLADKLSDKVSVIIAPPPTDGGFIGSTLLGAAAPRTAGESQ